MQNSTELHSHLRLGNTLSLLFVYGMNPDWRRAPEMIRVTWMLGGRESRAGECRLLGSQDFSVTALAKQRSAAPGLSLPPLFLPPLAPSPGADPLYMPCSSAITMTQFLLKTVFPKLQKEPGLVQELLKETVPLSLTMRAAEFYSRKCFVKNFW